MAGENVSEWAGRLPELEDGQRFPAVDPEVAAGIYGEVLGSQGGIGELVGGLAAVDDGGDWKVRFLIRGLVNHVGGPGKGEAKATVEAVLVEAASDGGVAAASRAFLLEQVRWICSGATLGKVTALLGEEDARLVDAAAAAVVTVGGAKAKAALREMAGKVAPERRAVLENALRQVG